MSLVEQIADHGFAFTITVLVLVGVVWAARAIGPRVLKWFDAQIALAQSTQTSLLGTTGILQRLDATLVTMVQQQKETLEEQAAWQQHMAAQINRLEQSMAILASVRSGETAECGTNDCPAMQILNRPTTARTRASDYSKEESKD
jgi:hypothetical protein